MVTKPLPTSQAFHLASNGFTNFGPEGLDGHYDLKERFATMADRAGIENAQLWVGTHDAPRAIAASRETYVVSHKMLQLLSDNEIAAMIAREMAPNMDAKRQMVLENAPAEGAVVGAAIAAVAINKLVSPDPADRSSDYNDESGWSLRRFIGTGAMAAVGALAGGTAGKPVKHFAEHRAERIAAMLANDESASISAVQKLSQWSEQHNTPLKLPVLLAEHTEARKR